MFYIDDKFDDYIDSIYLIELEIKDTTDTVRFASYLGPPLRNSCVTYDHNRITNYGVVIKVTYRVPLVGQELLTHPVHLS